MGERTVKLARFSRHGSEYWGFVDDGVILVAPGAVSFERALSDRSALSDALRMAVTSVDLGEVRLVAPQPAPPKSSASE